MDLFTDWYYPIAQPNCPAQLPSPIAQPNCPAQLPSPIAQPNCPAQLPSPIALHGTDVSTARADIGTATPRTEPGTLRGAGAAHLKCRLLRACPGCSDPGTVGCASACPCYEAASASGKATAFTRADAPGLARVFASAWRSGYVGIVEEPVLDALDEIEIADWLGTMTSSNGANHVARRISRQWDLAFSRYGEDPEDSRRGHITACTSSPPRRGVGSPKPSSITLCSYSGARARTVTPGSSSTTRRLGSFTNLSVSCPTERVG